MEDNHEQHSEEQHFEQVEHHEATPAPTAKLGQQVIYTDAEGVEMAAIVTKVDGDVIGITVFDPFHGAVPRYIEGVPHKEQDPEGGYWQ